MSGKGQNVYPVEKLCAVLRCCILRDLGALRQHLVFWATRCDTGNTLQVKAYFCCKSFTDLSCTCDPNVNLAKGVCDMKTILTALVTLGIGLTPVHAQETCTRDAMVVFDGSGSMAEMGFNLLDEPRIFDARRAVRKVMPQVAPVRRLGLVTYGFGRRESCASVVVRFPPQADAADRIVAEIDRLNPAGETPLTEAIAAAAHVLDYENKPGEIVLVTDGKETCGGSPCQLAADLAAGADMTVHVIGFRVRGEHFAWPDQPQDTFVEPVARCLADRTGGMYVRAETLDDLIGALRQTLGCQILSKVTSGRPAKHAAL